MAGWRTSLGAALLGGALVGCAAPHDATLRLSEELNRARADAAAQQARAAALESRLARIEQQQAVNDARTDTRELASRLDRLLQLNERLLAERAALPNPSTEPAKQATPAVRDEEQLRALVERMRGRPGRPHGGLSREQEAALRILIQPERKLDTDDLLPASFY